MNKIIGSIMGVGMIFASALPAFAATSATNTFTGPDSYNKINISRTWKTRVNNYQSAYVKNDINSENNTGDNKIKKNTVVEVNGITTGNATSNTTVTNNVNGAVALISGCGCQNDVTAANDTTGPYSTNKIYISDSHTVKVTNVQDAVVKNYISSNNDTGGNSVSYNTVAGGGITTGDASSNVTVENFVNAAETVIGPVGP